MVSVTFISGAAKASNLHAPSECNPSECNMVDHVGYI